MTALSKEQDTEQVDRVMGLAILMYETMMKDTNATKASTTVKGASYKGKLIGDIKVTVELANNQEGGSDE